MYVIIAVVVLVSPSLAVTLVVSGAGVGLFHVEGYGVPLMGLASRALLVGAYLGSTLLGLLVWEVLVLAVTLHAKSRMRRRLPSLSPGVDYGVGPDEWVARVKQDSPYREQDVVQARGSPVAAVPLITGNVLQLVGAILLVTIVVTGGCHVARYASEEMTHQVLREQLRPQLVQLQLSAMAYLGRHPDRYREGRCATVDELLAEGLLDGNFPSRDPWGSPWEVTRCGTTRPGPTPGASARIAGPIRPTTFGSGN